MSLAIPSNAEHEGEATASGPRVVTLTPAPAFDRIYRVNALRPGTLHRTAPAMSRLAGKGLNVAASLRAAACEEVRAVVALDPARTTETADYVRVVPVHGAGRVNTVVVDEKGETTNLNEAPEAISKKDWRRLCDAAIEEIDRIGADWLVVAGALPPVDHALPDPARLSDALSARGTRIALDSGGAALTGWLRSGTRIALVKPNRTELAAATGRTLVDAADIIAAARDLRAMGARSVLASLGEEGLMHADEEGARWQAAVPTVVGNTTGAGDAALAGFLAGASLDPGRPVCAGLKLAARWGALTAAALSPVAERLPYPTASRTV